MGGAGDEVQPLRRYLWDEGVAPQEVPWGGWKVEEEAALEATTG